MWNDKSVSVIFPTYREENSIYRVIEDFLSTGLVDEVVVVSNNAAPKTITEVEKTPAILLDEEKQGYGYAIRKGLMHARGDYIAVAEPDGTFTADDFLAMLEKVEDFDVVFGSRTHGEYLEKGAMNPLVRLGNIALAKLTLFLFKSPEMDDVGCTFRLIKREALEKIKGKFTVGGNHFSMEFILLCIASGLRIAMMPVHYRKRIGRSHGASNLIKAVRIGLAMMGLMLRFRAKKLFARSFRPDNPTAQAGSPSRNENDTAHNKIQV